MAIYAKVEKNPYRNFHCVAAAYRKHSIGQFLTIGAEYFLIGIFRSFFYIEKLAMVNKSLVEKTDGIKLTKAN